MEFKDLENLHQSYKKKVQKNIWIGVAVAVFFSLVTLIFSGYYSLPVFLFCVFTIGMIVAIFTLILTVILTQKDAKAYRSAYKAYFVEKALRNTFTELSYNHEAGLSESVLLDSQMVNTGDRYSSNDLTAGKYKDVSFTQADVHIETESTDSDGNTTYVTIFRGRFMIFEFPKKFNFRLEVVEKGFGASRVPKKDPVTKRKFERIKLESGEFNSTFRTYAEEGFEEFYLLDPTFINNTLILAEQHKGKILLGFIDNKLLIGLKDGKDAFEPPSVFKELNEATETAKIANDIHLITNFVDVLKLNNKLFK